MHTVALGVATWAVRSAPRQTLAVTGPGSDILWFWSRDHANASCRPRLTLPWSMS